MSNIALKWTGADSEMFIGRDSFGHVLLAGSWPSESPEWQEWKAIKPSDLLLLSLASCAAHDIVMILRRQRQSLEELFVEVDGTQAEDPPYQFTDVHVHYVVEGEDLDEARVERAIELSEEKYCSVAATIRGTTEITHSFEVRHLVVQR